MYATLENRQSHSLLAIHALKVQQAIDDDEHPHAWASLFIQSSAFTAVDYLIGTVWRIPVALISLAAGGWTELPGFDALFSCAVKTFLCAIGIVIFPLVGVFSPSTALSMLQKCGLIEFEKQELFTAVRRAIPKIDMEVWHRLADIRQEDLVSNEGHYAPRWSGPLFLASYLAEWEEVEIMHALINTTYKGESLLDVVAKRLDIKIESTGQRKLKVIEDIIHNVYPAEKE
jgi:hypothetical protein